MNNGSVADVMDDVITTGTLTYQEADVEGSLVEHRVWVAVQRC